MEIDESLIGRVLTLNKDELIVVGYDSLVNSYLGIKLGDLDKKYIRLYNSVENAVPKDLVIEYMNLLINEYEEIEEILAKKDYSTRFDIYIACCKIRECYKNVSACEHNSNYEYPLDKRDFYKREVSKHSKGLRRALSKLRPLLDEDEYYTFAEYLRENNYDLNTNKVTELKEKLICSKANFIKKYDLFMRELKR